MHLILSRTATGSSARFVAAVYSSYHTQPRGSTSGLLTSRVSLPTNFGLPLGFPRISLVTNGSGGIGNFGSGCTTPTATSMTGTAPAVPVVTVSSALDVDQGEYRGIMSLCRWVLKGATLNSAAQKHAEFSTSLRRHYFVCFASENHFSHNINLNKSRQLDCKWSNH